MAGGLEAAQAAAELAFRDTKCNAAGLPEPGHLIRSPLGAPECGPRNPNSTCMMDQCCSFAGYCGPIPDAQGRYFENGIQLSTTDATALYCNKQSYGDWRGWTATAGTCATIGIHYPVNNNLGWFGLAWPVIYAIGGGIAAFIIFLTVIAVAMCRRRRRNRRIAKKEAAATAALATRSSADDEQARLRPGTPATTLQGTTLHGTVRSSPSMGSLRGMPGPPPSAAAVRRTPTPTSAFDSPARSAGPSRPSWEPRPYVGAATSAQQLVVHGAGSAQPSLSSSARSAGPISLITAPSPHASLQHARSVSPLPGLQQQQPSAPGATAGPPGRGTGTPSVDMAASVHGWRVPSPAPASGPWSTASPGASLRVTIGPYAPPPGTYYASPVGSSPIPPPPPVSTGWAGQPPPVSSGWVAPPLPPVTSGWAAAPPPPGPMPTEFEYAPPPQTFATGWAPAPRPTVSSPPAVDLELPPGTIARVSPPLPQPPPPADMPVLPHYLRQWRAAAAGNPAGPSLSGPRRVLTSFEATRADELSVDAGAWVTVTRLFEDGWGLGRCGDEREGMFPLSVLAPRPEDAVLHALVRDMAALLDEDEWEDGGDASDVGGNAPALSAATMARATSTLSRCQSLVFPTRSRP